jgi:alanine-glyoxylate transaminase/serine-glyoxylate transaminase/serine-pyruvate transaminase
VTASAHSTSTPSEAHDSELLLIPGPVSVEPEVLAEVARPVRPHYGTDWAESYHQLAQAAARVFRCELPATLLFGPGMAAVEASITSSLAPGDEILIPANGLFADRMIEIAHAAGIVVHTGARPALAAPVDVNEVDRTLRAHPRIRALGIVHHETMLGVVNPLEELCSLARERNLLLIVDAISSLGGMEVRVDDWGIDLCAAVGNKCLGGTVGIAPIAVSTRAWEAILDGRDKRAGWYLDLRTWRRAEEEMGDWHPHPTTMPTGALDGLRVAIESVLATGLEAHCERQAAAARRVRAGLRGLGIELLVADEHASPVTTAALAPSWMDVDDYIAALRNEYGLRIAGAMGDLAGKVFRVGHMARAASPEVVEAYLDATTAYVNRKRGRGDRNRLR